MSWRWHGHFRFPLLIISPSEISPSRVYVESHRQPRISHFLGLCILQPPQLLRFAKAIYPYRKERQVEWGGHWIISTLNVSPINPRSPCFLFFILLMLPHLSMVSQMSKMSPTFASGGVMSRQCGRLVPLKHLLQRNLCTWSKNLSPQRSLSTASSSVKNWSVRCPSKQR